MFKFKYKMKVKERRTMKERTNLILRRTIMVGKVLMKDPSRLMPKIQVPNTLDDLKKSYSNFPL